jgi:hypothetical protein
MILIIVIKTKVAVLLVCIIRYDYPTTWPTFFKDFLSILPRGVEVVDIFLRVLHAIDEDIVCARVTPNSEEWKQVTLIKDTMRDQALPPIIESLHGYINSPINYRYVSVLVPDTICVRR